MLIDSEEPWCFEQRAKKSVPKTGPGWLFEKRDFRLEFVVIGAGVYVAVGLLWVYMQLQDVWEAVSCKTILPVKERT
jgi:hypothetical protein